MKPSSWPDFLSFYGTTDGVFRAMAVFLLFIVAVKYSTLFEEAYSQKLMDLYVYPWWRFLIVFLVIAAAVWCPRVGIMMAMVAVFYLSDMNTLIRPFSEQR